MEAHARHTDPNTSHDAAKAITPELTRYQKMVLGYARRIGPGGFIDLDMEETLGNHGSTYRTRRRELVDLGLIHDTGARERRPGDARMRVVWSITGKGRRA